MPRRHSLPAVWLFTDERMGESLWTALTRLPWRNAGVIFRHDHAPDRAQLARRVRAIAKARGLIFIVAGSPKDALRWGADGVHLRAPARRRGGSRPLIVTASAHDASELVAAARAGADIVFLSPLHATRSHKQAKLLGRVRFGLLARRARLPVAALGGMNARRFRTDRAVGATAWGAIDAWVER